MLKNFFEFINSRNIIKVDDKVLLAVSGGVDSVVLAHLFYKAGLRFSIAHCSFGLRLNDQAKEAAMVSKMAADYGVNFYSKSFDTKSYSKERGVSIQMAARDLRYEWFNSLCELYGYNKIATAHHLNDSLETCLFNLVKGTGIRGLHGISVLKGNVIRPLLFATKQMILEYARGQGLMWCEDYTNMNNDYSRNFLRNAIISKLKSINPGLETSFINTSKRLSALEELLDDYLSSLKGKILRSMHGNIYLDISSIIDKPWFIMIMAELLKQYGFSFASLDSFFSKPHQSGRVLHSRSHSITILQDNKLVVNTLNNLEAKVYLIEESVNFLDTEFFNINLSVAEADDYVIDPRPVVMGLDFDKLKFPLLVRRWSYGDRFIPLNLRGSKKVSDFLVDNKVPLTSKPYVYVVESDGEIACILNFRLDDRFKITNKTKKVYIINYNTYL
jgi:tRNA(Ile)-lysidine synthase